MCNNDSNGDMYPNGLPIFPEASLEELIEHYQADMCALAYSDLSYDTVQHLASRVNAAGCTFLQLPPKLTQIESKKPVVSICASRTGVGKSQTTRYIANYYKSKGLKVAVLRHPMPYADDLNAQRVQRYEKPADMDKYECTVEEREEYSLHIRDGNLLFAGVDYESILREAEKEADLIIWDGGNNDTSFIKSDLHIVLVDSLRPTDETHYYPGELNVRLADAVLITKVNDLEYMAEADAHAAKVKELKPGVPVFYGSSIVTPEATDPATGIKLTEEEAAALVKDKKVLVVDDGPTLTHGGLAHGAGYLLVEKLGAAEIVDPHPYAVGTIKKTLEKFPHLQNVLPAMGYGAAQMRDLQETIRKTPCDTVVLGTPSQITDVIEIDEPNVVARYELDVLDDLHEHDFDHVLDSYFERFYNTHQPRAA